MTQHIQIPRHHFIGSGSKPWLVVGRVPGADDDTAFLVLADDQGEAEATFVANLLMDYDDEDLEHARDCYGTDHYITGVGLLT